MARHNVTEACLSIDREPYDLIVYGVVGGGCRPNFNGHPDTWYPGEPEEVELEPLMHVDDGAKPTKVWDGELTREEEERARDAVFQAWCEEGE